MKVFVRTDASVEIGSGHVMRSLTLAGALHARGVEVVFICREFDGSLCDGIAARGFAVLRLPRLRPAAPVKVGDTPFHAAWLGTDWQTDADQTVGLLANQPTADWLLIDHYALDSRWEQALRPCVRRLMVVDDLADRPHDCDLLLDQNFYLNQELRYAALVPRHCRQLLGPAYAPLRPEFAGARNGLKERDGRVRRILVFFGASDLGNDTLKTLQALSALGRTGIALDIVLGVNHPYKAEVRRFAAAMPQACCHDYVNNMAELMAAADLYVGAAGTTTWERCCLGLPSLVITVAPNQAVAVADLDRTGAVRLLGEGRRLSSGDIARAIKESLENPAALAGCSRAALALVDGIGAQRCVDAMLEESEEN